MLIGGVMAKFGTIDELEVFQLAESLADLVWRAVMAWDHFAKSTVGEQLVRAADSVGANLAEGHASGSFTEFKRFSRYSKRSLEEVRFFLRRAQARQLLDVKVTSELRPLIETLRPKLGAFIESLDRRVKQSKIKSLPINRSTNQPINPKVLS